MIQDVVLSFILSVLWEVCPIWTYFTSLQFTWQAFVTSQTNRAFPARSSTPSVFFFFLRHLAFGPFNPRDKGCISRAAIHLTNNKYLEGSVSNFYTGDFSRLSG